MFLIILYLQEIRQNKLDESQIIMNIKKLILLSILLIGTQPIKLPFGGLSLFQVSVILIAIFGFFSLSGKKNVGGRHMTFGILYFISGCLAYFISINPDCRGSFLVSTMTSMIVFFVPVYFERNDIRLLSKTLIRSQYIAIPVGIFMWFSYYYLGAFPDHIDLPAGMSIVFDEEAQQRSFFGQDLRLSFPYSTPPVLSVAMAMSLVIMYYDKKIFAKGLRILIMMAFSVLLILTGSRTGIFGIILFVFFRLFFGGKKIKINWGVVFISLLLLLVVLYFASDIPYVEKFLGRFNSGDEELSEDRHLLVPIDGILIWLSSPQNFLFGIGFGSSLFMNGFLTFLPPHFLNSFVTLIAERGVMGLILVIMLIRMARVLYKREVSMSNEERALTFGLLTGLFSTLFYETFDCYFMIYMIAVGFMLEKRTRPVQNVIHK